MNTKSNWPHPLPKIRKSWRTWNHGAVVTLAKEIIEKKEWEKVPQVADLLEAAGCRDAALLRHLRGEFPCRWCGDKDAKKQAECYWCKGTLYEQIGHASIHGKGCYAGECWALNLILEREQPLTATFRWSRDMPPKDKEPDEARVINPGAWYGECYLVYVADCFSPPLYIVEAGSASDAEDEFVESDADVHIRIEHDSPEAKDYGFQVSPGDQIGGTVVTEKGWMNLKGEMTKEELIEPGTTGNGINYDSESVHIVDNLNLLRYHGPGLPPEGVDPKDYARKCTCDNCDKEFIPNTDGATKGYCSLVCEQHWLAPRKAPFVVCPVCGRYCWVPPDCEHIPGTVNSERPEGAALCELHFPSDSSSSYAMPARGLDDVVEDDGNQVCAVCPGSNQQGMLVRYTE